MQKNRCPCFCLNWRLVSVTVTNIFIFSVVCLGYFLESVNGRCIIEEDALFSTLRKSSQCLYDHALLFDQLPLIGMGTWRLAHRLDHFCQHVTCTSHVNMDIGSCAMIASYERNLQHIQCNSRWCHVVSGPQ